MKLDAAQLRDSDPTSEDRKKIKRKPIYIIIDNVLDTYNVGAIFRLADAMAVSGVYLVGETDIPTDEKVGHKIQKASVGTWKWVPWKHANTVKDAVDALKAENKVIQIIAIEQDKKSISYIECKFDYPVALVVGHETTGVSKEVLELADEIVEIPMYGVNKSLNVMVSLAIVLWEIGKKEVNDNEL